MSTQREKIINIALEILENRPKGIRYSELVREIKSSLPEIPKNTIDGTIWNLNIRLPDKVAKPERGLFILKKYLQGKVEGVTYKEENFYQPFADYLVNDLEECTKAIVLGGNKFGDKWGTPDVFGIYKFSEADPIKPPIEIVSAEIKLDINQLITAFGQACAYKLFSHKVYLVIPKDVEREISRLESLCARFGIGLILFNRSDPNNPDFEIRTRAIKIEPDYFYVNEYLKRLDKEDLKRLF